ncbi:MAG: hypothetical protein QME32_08005, partial [Endomicrobiia bacterium]|nr:hypothetical protein [Endomicrobiia bacterium]
MKIYAVTAQLSAAFRMTAIIFTLLIFTMLVPAPAVHAAFEESSVGARISALAGVSAGLSGGADSLAANPAQLSALSRPEVAAGYSRLHAGLSDVSEIARASLTFGYPVGNFTFGAGYDTLSLSGIYNETT